MAVQNLNMTGIKIKIPYGAGAAAVNKAYATADVEAAWAATGWAKRLHARKTRAGLTDFDRFKVKALKQRKAR